jgi:hypothetical protein
MSESQAFKSDRPGEPPVLTDAQERSLRALCQRYRVEFTPAGFHRRFDLPSEYVAGWVGPIYVGCDAEGRISS